MVLFSRKFLSLVFFRKQHSAFMEFSCGIVRLLTIGKKKNTHTQNVLRKEWGKNWKGPLAPIQF